MGKIKTGVMLLGALYGGITLEKHFSEEIDTITQKAGSTLESTLETGFESAKSLVESYNKEDCTEQNDTATIVVRAPTEEEILRVAFENGYTNSWTSAGIEKALANDEAKFFSYVRLPSGGNAKMGIPTPNYTHYKMKNNHARRFTSNFENWVTYEDPIIKDVAEVLQKESRTDEELAQNIVHFVNKNIIYDTSIEQGFDYIKFPVETLVEGSGDCEDTAILTAAIMKAAGLDVALIDFDRFENGKQVAGHYAVGVAGSFHGTYYDVSGTKYFYAETTGWEEFGEHPGHTVGDMSERYRSGTGPNRTETKVYVIE